LEAPLQIRLSKETQTLTRKAHATHNLRGFERPPPSLIAPLVTNTIISVSAVRLREGLGDSGSETAMRSEIGPNLGSASDRMIRKRTASVQKSPYMSPSTAPWANTAPADTPLRSPPLAARASSGSTIAYKPPGIFSMKFAFSRLDSSWLKT
jgi:hypothetical protein